MIRKIGDKITIRPDLKVGMGTNDSNYVIEDMLVKKDKTHILANVAN